MKKEIKLFLASAIAVGLLAGQAAGAAGLVPDCAGSTCTVCHILLLISNIYSFIVKSVLPPLAGLLFLVGGIMMIASAGSEERYKKGRQVLINAAIGVVIVLLSWVIVNTLITAFGSNNVQGFNASGWWNPSMTCTAPASNINQPVQPAQPAAVTGPDSCNPQTEVWQAALQKCGPKPLQEISQCGQSIQYSCSHETECAPGKACPAGTKWAQPPGLSILCECVNICKPGQLNKKSNPCVAP